MSNTAPTPTPALAPTTPSKPAAAAPEAPPAPPPPRTKVYTTKQVVDGVRVNTGKAPAARVVNGGAPTPPTTESALLAKAAPAPAEPPQETPAPAVTSEPAPSPGPEANPAAGEGADTKPVAPVARETQAPAEEPQKLTDSEMAKRLAKISRAEAKVEERERQHAGKVALADAFAQALPGVQLTPETVREALTRVATIEQVRQGRGVQSKLALIQQVFGWDFASLADEAVAETAKKPEQRAAEQAGSTVKSELDSFRQEMKQDRLRQQEQQTQREIGHYIDTTVATAIADKAKFPLLHGKLGATAAREVYNIQAEHWRRHQEGLSPAQAAEALEKHLRTQAESDAKLLGLSAPAPATPPKRTEPAKNGTAQKPPVVKPATTHTVRPRETARPYSTHRAR